MKETIRSTFCFLLACTGIFCAAQLLRTADVLSFLPDSHAEQVVAAMGNMVSHSLSDGVIAVFAP